MTREFYREENSKTKGFVRWALSLIFIGLLAFGLFSFLKTEGRFAGEFLKGKFALVFGEITSDALSKKAIASNLEKSGVKFINELPSNIALGAGNSNEKNIVSKMYGPSLSMFRGNPTRSWYGTGAIPKNPTIEWRYPDKPMCSESSDKGETRVWCGNGWTGQPVVYEHDGMTEIIFGAYDKNVHFVNAETGKDTRAPFPTGDIIKGSVTLDPDGLPLLYFGSRDNKLRIVSLENGGALELWSLDSKDLPGIWNDDWDSNPLIMDDILFTGGENGWFFAIKLNRGEDANGDISVAPEILFTAPGYDDALLAKVGNNVSIENSVAMFEDTVYFANSGGRIMGLDIKHVEDGVAPVVFDYWVGDDVDASIVIDEDGNLYVAAEEERLNARSKEIGQLIKLDPTKADPLVWSVKVPSKAQYVMGGIWATPALHENFIYVATNPGELLGINKTTGEVIFRDNIGAHAWSSPIISEKELLVTTCDGRLRTYSLANPEKPEFVSEFSIPTKSCIESTPALWDGNLYFGARDGYFYKLSESSTI